MLLLFQIYQYPLHWIDYNNLLYQAVIDVPEPLRLSHDLGHRGVIFDDATLFRRTGMFNAVSIPGFASNPSVAMAMECVDLVSKYLAYLICSRYQGTILICC